jgi:rhamnogalacturonan endolyase
LINTYGGTAGIKPWTHPYKEIQLQRPPTGAQGGTYTPNDCSVGDLDGDGEYEIVVKWDPSNAQDNSKSGRTDNVIIDAYKFNGDQLWRIDLGPNIRAGAHYTQFLVYDFDGDGKAEMICKTAAGSKDGKGSYVTNDSNNGSYLGNGSGYILTGNEYLTVFNGPDGKAMHTIPYKPARGTVSSWGDDYGNRVDRFLACVAYLDGKLPSAVMCRGYYTRLAAAAYDYRDGKLTERWVYDSGNTESSSNLYGQGNHNLSVGDVDNDGKDEIILGSGAIDDDGTMMYRTGLGHGDAMHLGDLDPTRPGLEVFEVHEDEVGYKTYGYEMHDARTGEIIWGGPTDDDNARGLAADIDPNHCGFEFWSSMNSNVFDASGRIIQGLARPKTNTTELYNFRIYWDGDVQDELLDGNKIAKGDGTRLLTATASSINGSKANPCLQADILGDWREEVIYSKDDNKLVIYTTTHPSDHRFFTLMHDHIYRLGIAWQNVAYNQPPHLGYYIGATSQSCVAPPAPVPNIYTTLNYRWTGDTDTDWKNPSNWSDGVVPSASDKVTIPAITTVDNPPVLAAATKVNTILFEPGAELGRQDFLDPSVKGIVQLKFNKTTDRKRWWMLASPFEQLFSGDFSFGGKPQMDLRTFVKNATSNEGEWKKPTAGLAHEFTFGSHFALNLNDNEAADEGLSLAKDTLELPFFESRNVPLAVHNHTYVEATKKSTVGTTEFTRNLAKAYHLAGSPVIETLTFGKGVTTGTSAYAAAGNPFISSIGFAALTGTTGNEWMKPSYYIFSGANTGSYSAYNSTLGTYSGDVELTDRIVPMQSFIVEKATSSLDTETLTLLLANISAITDGTSAGLRSAHATVGDKLAIVAATAAAPQTTVRTVIGSHESGSALYNNVDTRKFSVTLNSMPDIYSLKPDANNQPVAIGVNVLGPITEEYVVPLGLSTTYEGEITLTFSGMDSYNACITLNDAVEEQEIDLTGRNGFVYTFNYVPQQSGETVVACENRFAINLSPAMTTSTGNRHANNVLIFNRGNSIQIVSGSLLEQVTVFNLNGQAVYSHAPENVRELAIDGMSDGIYTVKVVNENEVITKKLIIE